MLTSLNDQKTLADRFSGIKVGMLSALETEGEGSKDAETENTGEPRSV